MKKLSILLTVMLAVVVMACTNEGGGSNGVEAFTVCNVFTISNNEINLVFFNQIWKVISHHFATNFTNYVANK